MAMKQVKATTKIDMGPGMVVDCQSQGFKFKIDMPEEAGGTFTSQSPVETLLSSLGACQVITAKIYAKAMHIDLQEIWADLEGYIDMDGFKGVKGVKTGFQNIKSTIHVKSDAPEAKINKLIDTVNRICPVGDTLKGGFPIDCDIVIEK